MYKITVFPGDGIGPEVTAEALKVLKKTASVFHLVFEFKEALLGGASIDQYGVPMSDEARKLALEADAVFLGAVGGPKWDALEASKRPEKALLELRKMLGVFTNLRPVKLFKGLEDNSTLKREVIEGLDFLILRELTMQAIRSSFLLGPTQTEPGDSRSKEPALLTGRLLRL